MTFSTQDRGGIFSTRAFTPTCSSVHLPRYNELAPAFYANGVDKIVCVSSTIHSS